MPAGWSLILAEIDGQCECWCFGAADRERLTRHMSSLYWESKEFLEI